MSSARVTLFLRGAAAGIVSMVVTLLAHHGMALNTSHTIQLTSGVFIGVTGLWNLAEAKGWLNWLKYFGLGLESSDGTITKPTTTTPVPTINGQSST